MNEYPIWTLSEANEAVGEVVRVTEEAHVRLQEIDAVWGALGLRKFDALHGVAEEDLVRAQWAHRVATLGVMPKGFFVVDFQSPEPDTVYCWSFGETVIEHEHKLWENFTERRRIADISQP